MGLITYQTLSENEIYLELFKDFIRHQTVTKC